MHSNWSRKHTVRVYSTIYSSSLHEILKEEEKKKTVTKKKTYLFPPFLIHRLTGNRLCILSNKACPYYYLYSSPANCPSWPHPIKQEKQTCVYGDGPARYKDPSSGQPYCSLKCFQRLKAERDQDCLLTFHNIETEVKPSVFPALPSQQIPPPQQQPPQSPPQSQQPPQQPPSAKSPPLVKSKPLPMKTEPQAAQKPMIVSTTTPQGQVMQYQLDIAKPVYINTQSVTVPVNQNQVYYLQTALPNGEKSVRPHLMTGSSRMNDGNVYYCMVPMVPLSTPSTTT